MHRPAGAKTDLVEWQRGCFTYARGLDTVGTHRAAVSDDAKVQIVVKRNLPLLPN